MYFIATDNSYAIIGGSKTFLTLILLATSSLYLMGCIKVIQSPGLLSPDLLSIQLKYVYIECIIFFFGRITKWIKHMQYLSYHCPGKLILYWFIVPFISVKVFYTILCTWTASSTSKMQPLQSLICFHTWLCP